MLHLRKKFTMLLLIAILLSACSPKNANTDPNTSRTSATEAVLQVSATVAEPAATNPPPPSATLTSLPTATLTPVPPPTEIPADTATPIPPTPACTNKAALVKHLSFSDNSTIYSGLFFGKSWRIQNTGTCTWTTAYAIVFASGEQMNAPAETLLPHEVAPGETIDIQLLMKAPDVANTYTGNWMLRDSNGVQFGVGELADQPIDCKIIVKLPSTKDFHPFPECG